VSKLHPSTLQLIADAGYGDDPAILVLAEKIVESEQRVGIIDASDQRLRIKVDDLKFPSRIANILKGRYVYWEGEHVQEYPKIDTVGQLVVMTEYDLRGRRNCGEKSVNEIKEKLRDLGLHLGTTVMDESFDYEPSRNSASPPGNQ
jgi:DNA-directed RNA polymerase alpha subunit